MDRSAGLTAGGHCACLPSLGGMGHRDGLLIAGLGFLSALFLSGVAFAVLVDSSAYDTVSSAGTGAYVGRIGGQTLLSGQPGTALGIPLWMVALLQIPLWVGLGGSAWLVARRSKRSVIATFGVHLQLSDAPRGLLLGAVTQLLLVPVLYVPIFWLFGKQDVSAAARGLSDRADSALGIGLLVLVVGIGAPIVEEIYYRGLVQQSLSAKIGSTAAILMTAFVFGLSHFQLLQLPALVLFGAIVGVAAHRFGRLGLSIWTHVGFNMVTVVALLVA